MNYGKFANLLADGTKNFCFLFSNPYDVKTIKKNIEKLGHTITYLDGEDFKNKIGRAVMFSKPFYWLKYDSALWTWASKNRVAYPFIMEAADKRCKVAEEYIGIPEATLLEDIKKSLEEKNCRFDPGGWKTLVDAHRNKNTGQIEDPEGLYNKGYSIGLQVEVVNAETVKQSMDTKAAIWDLFNSLVAGNKMNTLKSMYFILTDEEAIGLCLGLQKMLGDLIDAYKAQKSGKSSSLYAAERGMHPYRAQKLFEQAAATPHERYTRLLDLLTPLEVRLKSNSMLSKSEVFRNAVMLYLELENETI